MAEEPKVVVIGGGTGSFTLLGALKSHFSNITALVSMADDGGSTGVLRDELGVLPPGDVRQCLVALAREPRVRDLFNYRFDEGTFAGHSFGNLFLTAVERMTSNFADAVKLASKVLDTSGQVVPITLDNVRLVLEQSNGLIHRGEATINKTDFGAYRQPVLRLEPRAIISPDAKQAIEKAGLVVIAPGSLYGSLAPALIVEGVSSALAKSQAAKVYVCNLVTKPGQTDGFTVADFAAEIERFLAHKVQLDYVLYNNAKPNAQLLKRYAQEGEHWVTFSKQVLKKAHFKAIGGYFVSDKPWRPASKHDILQRTFIRHDAEAIAKALRGIARGQA